MDSLERLENVFKDVPLGSRFFDPNDVELVIKELRAARETVSDLIRSTSGNFDPDNAWNMAMGLVDEKMKEARNNP